MNRYRAFIKSEKRIVEVLGIDYGYEIIRVPEYDEVVDHVGFRHINFNEIILMESLKKKDKNNKTIHEGDWVRWADEEGFFVWDDRQCGFKLHVKKVNGQILEEGYLSDIDLSFSDTDIEILGNIHENPPLEESHD